MQTIFAVSTSVASCQNRTPCKSATFKTDCPRPPHVRKNDEQVSISLCMKRSVQLGSLRGGHGHLSCCFVICFRLWRACREAATVLQLSESWLMRAIAIESHTNVAANSTSENRSLTKKLVLQLTVDVALNSQTLETAVLLWTYRPDVHGSWV